MTRSALIDRIRELSDDELEVVAPFLAADLEVAADLSELLREVELARESAATSPQFDHQEVMRQARDRVRPKP